MGNCVKSPLRNLSRKIHQEEKTCYTAVQTSEEGLVAAEFPGPLMMLAQNCAVMHNLLGPACIFLRKGFAENRQPVRKLSWWWGEVTPGQHPGLQRKKGGALSPTGTHQLHTHSCASNPFGKVT
ncbi:calcium-binding protein 1-like [Dromiciops gliroides]|uniref:calcium-binding protein 1-like n=1 Tax=Dromiciops gliroides TaxID=33562 RepID=UPI001CC7F8C1|nr:calcium-binding protein 1-like [Dromiciops gliroides]